MGPYGRFINPENIHNFLLHLKLIKCFTLILMICNHFVGKIDNQGYNDAYNWRGDVRFLRELLQRRIPL